MTEKKIEYFDELFEIDFGTAHNMFLGEGKAVNELCKGVGSFQDVVKEDVDGLLDGASYEDFQSLVEDRNFVGSVFNELLSLDESSAMENFLDSIISKDKKSLIKNTETDVPNIISELPLVISTSIPTLFSSEKVQEMAESKEYFPQSISLPEIKILESSIPEEIRNNRTKVREWKHVYCEKQRRLMFKKAFNDLISMVKFPRPSCTDVLKLQGINSNHIYKKVEKRSEPGNGKRIPKHVLLQYITEDIRFLILANSELERLIKTSMPNR